MCEDFIVQVNNVNMDLIEVTITTPIQSINIDNVLPLLDKVLETEESIIEEACWRLVNNSKADLMF